MILKLGVKGFFYLFIISGTLKMHGVLSASSFGYMPYTYRVSMADEANATEEIDDFEDSIFFTKTIGTNALFSQLPADEIELEDFNSSTPLIKSILSSAMEFYISNESNSSAKIDDNLSEESEKIYDAKKVIALKDINSSSATKNDELLLVERVVERNSTTTTDDSNKTADVRDESSELEPKKIVKEIKKRPSKLIYEVKRGDSFIKLARDFNTTVFDIKEWNKIKDRDIVRLNEKLIIYPDKKTPYEKIKEILKLRTYGRYIVEKGDTLSTIVRKFAVGKKETKRVNRLKDGNSIRVGQKLIIPLPQKRIDAIVKKIEAKKRAKRLALERKRKLEMARRGRYSLVKGKIFRRKIRVVATAYTSHRNQTDRTPFLAAWNNRIRPGMRIIAVSNDLIRRYGITNGTRVRISGLPGVYVVRDKMHPRLRNHIDIYMGRNLRKALRWGRKRVTLYW